MQTITYPSLDQPGCVAMTFSRLGGVSPVPYDSLNIGYHVGDMPERVAENRQRIRAHLGLAALASCQQVHGDRVLVVSETALKRGQTRGQSPGDGGGNAARGFIPGSWGLTLGLSPFLM